MTLPDARERIPFPLNTVKQGDAIRLLMKLPAASVDLIVTDPPYNVASPGKCTLRSGKPASTDKVWGAWDMYHPFDYDVLMLELVREAYRVLQPGGAFYCFTAREYNGQFIRWAVERGFVYRNQLMILKRTPLPSLTKKNWRSAFEVCAYLTKGPPRVFHFLSRKHPRMTSLA
ncbi:MAG: DNA methyltransferase [Planctomycetota bacterium]